MVKGLTSRSGFHRLAIDALQARRCVVLVGPPGIGKTTIVTLLEQHWIERGLEVHRASTSLSAQRVSLAALAGLLAKDSTTIPAAISDLRSLDGLLVIDDADLLDEDSAVVIHTIARSRSILISIRDQRASVPDAVTRLCSDLGTERITIESLSADEAAKVVESRLGGPLDRDSIELLLRTSEGNPLLLRELLDASQHAGTLTLRNGVWTLSELSAASSVREMFRERVARWPKAVTEVVATVAIAECVPKPLLVECFGAALVNEAQTLDAFRIRPGSGEFEVRHALLNDAVVADLTRDQRRSLLRTLVLLSVQHQNHGDHQDQEIHGNHGNLRDFGVTHLRRGLWLSILGDDEKLDTEVLLQAADKAYSAMHRRESLALAELAYQRNPCRQTLEFLIRVGGHVSEPDEAAPVDEILRVGEYMNRAESYVHGLSPLGNLVEQIRYAEATTTDPDALLDYQMMNAWMEFSHGCHPERSIEALGPLARGDFSLAAPRVAAMPASISYRLVGRLHESIETGARLATVQSLLQLTLGAFLQAEANVELGRTDIARTHMHFLTDLESTDNMPAKLLRCSIEARLLLRNGRPREACRTLGTYINLTAGFDPMGGRAFAQAWLAVALAWSNNDATNAAADSIPTKTRSAGHTNISTSQSTTPGSFEGTVSTISTVSTVDTVGTGAVMVGSIGVGAPVAAPVSPPAYAGYFDCELLLAHAQYLAESGLLIDARSAALSLVDEANARGHYLAAMGAAHLAMRIQPTHTVSEIVATQAARIDGDLAETIARHAAELVEENGPGLEKIAQRFIELGHLSLAHETFVIASHAYRTQSQKNAAARCNTAAEQLQKNGCTPTFAVRKTPIVVETLTLREREVSIAIAEGQTQRAVADALGMSIRTVETHLHRAYRKLAVTNATELQNALNK